MLRVLNWQSLSLIERKQQLTRANVSGASKQVVGTIIASVKEQGDAALFAYGRQFDGVNLSSLTVSAERIENATVSAKALSAIQTAIEAITVFHKVIMPKAIRVDTAKGIYIERRYRPINKVGLYVPGGNKTPLISSVLMQAIPAWVAGCSNRVLCTPPNAKGEIDASVLVAARLCQIQTIYTIGGAQAIAAMAYGTESVMKVDKIFGPGNAFVTEAKTQVSMDSMGAAIDMPAGPSEVMIISDCDANPHYVAADLLAQAEHGPDSQVILLCESADFAASVNLAIAEQLQTLTRASLILQSLQHGAILVCSSREEMIAIVNDYAPEHLIVNCVDAECWVDFIDNAGTIFLGPYAAETMGDYVTGSNHVLPTNGYARSYSGLSTFDFLKSMSVQSVSKEGVATLGEAAFTLAIMEGLDAHANAIRLRLNALEEISCRSIN